MQGNPIVEWLKSYRPYKKGVELFKIYGIADYPKIWELVSRGNYPGNRDLLEHHLKLLSKKITSTIVTIEPKKSTVVIHKEPPPEVVIEQPKQETPGTGIAAFSNLNKSIRQTLQRRMQLSQSFHDVSTDYERSLICDSIDEVNNLLTELNAKNEYYEREGTMPPEEDTSFQLSDNYDGLTVQLNRKHSHKLKLQRSIEEMMMYDEGHPKRKKLYQKQQLLKDTLAIIQSIKHAKENIQRD